MTKQESDELEELFKDGGLKHRPKLKMDMRTLNELREERVEAVLDKARDMYSRSDTATKERLKDLFSGKPISELAPKWRELDKFLRSKK